MKYEIIKGSEKDFDGAPESALVKIHYKGDEDDFVFAEKFELAAKFWYVDGSLGSLNGYYNHGTVIAERRPITEPAWDGEGLPPVGVECEFASCSIPDRWYQGIVRYLSEHTIVIEHTVLANGKAESIAHPRTMNFRPIRSPEDVARDEAVYDLEHHDSSCESIYDAIAEGKIRGVKLEGK